MTKTPFLLAVLLLGLAGCATKGSDDGHASAAVERGRAFAERACSRCHGMDGEASPLSTAPPFRAMRRRLNQILYERRVAELTGRHMGMPPMEMTEDQVQDLAAYVRSLK